MIRILLSWILQFVILAGVGGLCVRAGLGRLGMMPRETNLFQRFWIGLAVVLTLLQLWHLVAPVNAICWLVIAGLGVAGLPMLWADRTFPAAAQRSRLWWWLAFLSLAALIPAWDIASYLTDTSENDTRLYHLNIVRWYNEYPVVPGLANLHSRFGFNSAFLLYAALWDNLAWDTRSAWVTHCFIELVAVAQWLWVLVSVRRYPLVARAFALFSLPCLLFPLDRASPSLYYDLLSQSSVLVLVLEILSLKLFAGKRDLAAPVDDKSARQEVFDRAPLFLALAAIGFVGKPIGAMTLFMVTCGLALAAWRWEKDLPAERGWVSRWALRFALPTLLVAGYLARNVFLSGWLLYPSPVFNLHLSWSLPPDQQSALYAIIKGFARFPEDGMRGMTMAFWEWFPAWKRGFDRLREKELLILGMALWPAFLFAALRKGRGIRTPVELFLLLLSVANLLFWFALAPDMRFGFGFLWIFTALGLAFAVTHLIRRPKGVLLFALVGAVYFVSAFRFELIPTRPTNFWRWGQARSNKVVQVTVKNGQSPPLQLWIPAPGEVVPGDAPLPATNHAPLDTLRLRVPGNLRWGFEQSPDPGEKSKTP